MAVPSPSIPSTSGSPLRVQLPSSSSGPSAISGSYRRPPSQLPRPGVEVVRFLPDTFRGLAGSRLRKKHKQTPVMARSAASGMARVSQSPKSTEPSFGPNAFPTLPLSSVFVSLRRPCSAVSDQPRPSPLLLLHCCAWGSAPGIFTRYDALQPAHFVKIITTYLQSADYLKADI